MAKARATRRLAPRLLADIGGTTIRLGLQRPDGIARGIRIYATAEFDGLEAVIRRYLAEPAVRRLGDPEAAALAVAGPVTGDRIKMTNLPWAFSLAEIGRACGLHPVLAVNDFVAVSESVAALKSADVRKIGGGAARPDYPIAVLGPGTGLGVSALVPSLAHGRTEWIAVASEGGHASLAAGDAREAAVVEALRRRYGHVSAERALSGQGLVNLYEALGAVTDRPAKPLTPAGVTRAARKADLLARDAVAMFCAMLGAFAGNLALTYGAHGGVYIAGGIVPKLGPLFDSRLFRERFVAKGRYRNYLAAIPTCLVTHKLPAFLGLAAILDRHARTTRAVQVS